MRKMYFSKALFLTVLLFSTSSCTEDTILDETAEKPSLEVSDLSTDNISYLKSISTNYGENQRKSTKDLETIYVFEKEGKDVIVKSNQLEKDKNIYDLDLNNDGSIDFKIQPVRDDFSEVYYLDNKGKKLSKAKYVQDGNSFYIVITEVYNDDNSIYRRGGWRDCFESVSSSAEGIAGMVVANFAGPEAVLGYYCGIAIGCAF
ncbi:hypothetical protein GO491_10735 [Flavobacteriaceae bacterium Ap0902]|nr:hypothetical protein [Flavobacteriaceae bacterium Ap0902]